MLLIPFDNSYARLPASFYTRQAPTPVDLPQLIAFNRALADQINITGTSTDDELALIFAGNTVPAGADPLAQAYGGHQFGNWAGQLGDGRAILLGETVGQDGIRRDIHLKGSGPTPYSRAGDGRAWLGPVLREYVISEANHALGIPTTRALAAVTTGETVWREKPLPGAVLTRVARSHIRVGTFQLLMAQRDTDGLRALFDHCVARHYPQAETPLDLLTAVIEKQAALVAQWMSVGFIHGVMNTDNTLISGETIDYGPCAFLDDYHPMTVFSSIDRKGRYAYANKPDIITWNMAQLATSLIPLVPDQDAAVESFTNAINAMPARLQREWHTRFSAKIGLTTQQPDDTALINDLLSLMAQQGADFTNTFRALATDTARDQFTDPAGFDLWAQRWHKRLETEPTSNTPETTMRQANPAFIPRNHRIEQMIEAAVQGDYAPFHRLNKVLAQPFTDQPDAADLTRPPQDSERVHATFCGT